MNTTLAKISILIVIAALIVVIFRTSIFNFARPFFLDGGDKNCLDTLDEMNVQYKSLGDMHEGQCVVKNAVRIEHYPDTRLSSPVTLTCPSATNLALFLADIGAKEIKHLGAYNCRDTRGSRVTSEHGYGTAIDISEIDSASLLSNWKEDSTKGKILNSAYVSACLRFSNVFTPDYNSAHANHFHLDNGFGLGC